MRHGLKVLGMAAVLFASVAGAEEAALPSEALQAGQKAAAISSYRTRFTLEAQEEDGQMFQLEGTLLFRAPNQRRLEIRPPGAQEDPQRVISDGKTEWQSYPQGEVVYRLANPPEAPGPHRPFSEAAPGTVRFVGDRQTAEGKILRFEATPEPKSVDGAPVPIEKIRIEIAEKDGLTREVALLDSKGNAVMTQKFLDVQVNVPVSDSDFSYTPPKGVTVLDAPVP